MTEREGLQSVRSGGNEKCLQKKVSWDEGTGFHHLTFIL